MNMERNRGSVAYLRGGACGHALSERPKTFLTRHTVKNGTKCALKIQEMPFQRPKIQNISGVACPRTPLKFCRHYGLPLNQILATLLLRLLL